MNSNSMALLKRRRRGLQWRLLLAAGELQRDVAALDGFE